MRDDLLSGPALMATAVCNYVLVSDAAKTTVGPMRSTVERIRALVPKPEEDSLRIIKLETYRYQIFNKGICKQLIGWQFSRHSLEKESLRGGSMNLYAMV